MMENGGEKDQEWEERNTRMIRGGGRGIIIEIKKEIEEEGREVGGEGGRCTEKKEKGVK